MNKKYRLLVISCVLCLQGWSQLKEGTSVLYKYNDLFLQITINGEKKKLPDRFCRMVFTDSSSFTYRFSEDEKKDPYKGQYIFKMSANGFGTYYYPSTHDLVVFLKKKKKIYQVRDTVQHYKWELFDDQKVVAGFQCRSALTFRNQTDSVIAWYTTEITGFYSPSYYTGLPGVVLEIQDNHTGDRISAIKVESMKLDIRFPEKATIVKDLYHKK